jgi:hypothetical protein
MWNVVVFCSGVQVRRMSMERMGRAAYKPTEERIHMICLTRGSSLLGQDRRSQVDTCEVCV